ncbi:nitroreductase family protein [Bacillus alveayuensis]|uniref:nitroreductase family protein n=1 Tax=Aeribacillus alveayuensis TaxID=279215 RepID=UPI0005CCE7E9|nr:nitroreductase family protein [Bacillus alveayuensis]
MHDSFLNILKSRRSIRNWINKKIPEEKIIRLVEAARWAPSSCNRQSTKLLFVSDQKGKDLITQVSTGGKGFANLAHTMIIVLSDLRIYNLPYERNLAYIDGALAAQNLLLQAHVEGLGACYLNWALDKPETETVLYKHFNIPKYMVIVGVIPIGYPDESVEIKISERKPLGNFIIRENFINYKGFEYDNF